jgi:hypothetical protein
MQFRHHFRAAASGTISLAAADAAADFPPALSCGSLFSASALGRFTCPKGL